MNEHDIFQQFRQEHNEKLNEQEKQFLFEKILERKKKKKKKYILPVLIPSFCVFVLTCLLIFLPNKKNTDIIASNTVDESTAIPSHSSTANSSIEEEVKLRFQVIAVLEDKVIEDITYHSYQIEISLTNKQYSIYTTDVLELNETYEGNLIYQEGLYFVSF